MLLLPLPSKTQPVSLCETDIIYISKRKTVKELINKLTRIYSAYFDFDFIKAEKRLWRINSQFNINKAWKKWTGQTFNIKGAVLEENITIDETKMNENDVLIFEVHYLKKNWFLTNDPIDSKVSKNFKQEELQLNIFDINFSPYARKGVVCLGDTSFMNSVFHCLSNTLELTNFFLTKEYKKDLNKGNPLKSGNNIFFSWTLNLLTINIGGKIAKSYKDLMKAMWKGSSLNISSHNLNKICGTTELFIIHLFLRGNH